MKRAVVVVALLLLLLAVAGWMKRSEPSHPSHVFRQAIHGANYECQLRESAAWNTDMIICWPVDAFSRFSQGVMRFWRENPSGLVGELPCQP